jgi:hypothetical protein
MKTTFEAYKFVNDLQSACEKKSKNTNGQTNYAYAYGAFSGNITFALSNLNLTQTQINELNRILTVAQQS